MCLTGALTCGAEFPTLELMNVQIRLFNYQGQLFPFMKKMTPVRQTLSLDGKSLLAYKELMLKADFISVGRLERIYFPITFNSDSQAHDLFYFEFSFYVSVSD